MDALFLQIRALGRSITLDTLQHKSDTVKCKEQMDRIYLDLQNLLYERRHLEHELEQCRNFQ